MISHLKGTIAKGAMGEVSVDTGGVGYRVQVPMTTWDLLAEGAATQLWISSYIREDRFDLFGFEDSATRMMFESLINLQGIGPRMGLELCAVPRSMLHQAIVQEDHRMLTAIKGIGKKSAEKLLIELKNLAEKQPMMFQGGESGGTLSAKFDRDAVAALSQLGYATTDIMQALEGLPKHLTTTEERVTAALRSL
jgi:Holliday junction DNA helicase RuvA